MWRTHSSVAAYDRTSPFHLSEVRHPCHMRRRNTGRLCREIGKRTNSEKSNLTANNAKLDVFHTKYFEVSVTEVRNTENMH